MKKGYIFFDMDGTIADLYKVENWLDRLHAEDAQVYTDAKPRRKAWEINVAIRELVAAGWEVRVISWAAMDSKKNSEFFQRTKQAKKDWMAQHFSVVPKGKVLVTEYGNEKGRFARQIAIANRQEAETLPCILVDDNKEVRANWRAHGDNWTTIDASRGFLPKLYQLLAH